MLQLGFFFSLLVFQMHTVLDEIIFGGQVLETSSTEVMKAVEEISKYSLPTPLTFFPLLVSE